MAKRTTKKASKKQYTLAEFKAWLEGIEELQPASWAPDASQWKTIRDKMMNIVEEVVEVETPRTVEDFSVPAGHQAQPQFQQPAAQQPSAFIPQQSSLPVEFGEPEMTAAAAAALGGKLPTEMVPSADGKLKTPNIDTSDGNYTTSFE